MTTREKSPRTGRLRGGWTPMYREVWSHYLPLIGKDALVFYLYLLDHRNTDESNPRFGKAWPGRRKVAKELAISPKQLPKIDAALEGAGLVEVERVASGGGRARIEYVVNDPLDAENIDSDALREQIECSLRKLEDSLGKLECSQGKQINTYLSRTSEQELIKDMQAASQKSVADYNAKDILAYFLKRYQERYNEEYVIPKSKWPMELRNAKTQLLDRFGAEKSAALIDKAIELYESVAFNLDMYPRPSLYWMRLNVNQLLPYVTDSTALSDTPTNASDTLSALNSL